MTILSVPYVSQWDPIIANTKVNDCGCASILMALQYYGLGGTLTVDQLSAETTLRQSDTGLNCTQLVMLAARHGLKARVNSNTNLDQIRAQLTSGNPVIPLIALRDIPERVDQADNKPGHDLHFFVLIGFDDDTFTVNDPDAWNGYIPRATGMVIKASELDKALSDAIYSRQCVFMEGTLPMVDTTKLTAWKQILDALSADIAAEIAAPPVVPVPPVLIPGTPKDMIVASGPLNVRNAPALKGIIVGQLQTGDAITVVDGPNAGGHQWGQIQSGPFIAQYVAEDLLKSPN